MRTSISTLAPGPAAVILERLLALEVPYHGGASLRSVAPPWWEVPEEIGEAADALAAAALGMRAVLVAVFVAAGAGIWRAHGGTYDAACPRKRLHESRVVGRVLRL